MTTIDPERVRDANEPECDAESGVEYGILVGPEMRSHCTKCSIVTVACEVCGDDTTVFAKVGELWLCPNCAPRHWQELTKAYVRMVESELVAETEAHKETRAALAASEARVREQAQRIEELERELNQRRQTGALLANCAYNASQPMRRIDQYDRKCMSDVQKAWDAIKRVPDAASPEPKETTEHE